jgi:Mg2+/Co2+ transporter CorB
MKMKMYDDDWFVDDAEKRVRKLNKRMNYKMSEKNRHALERMIFRAIKWFEFTVHKRNLNKKEGK